MRILPSQPRVRRLAARMPAPQAGGASATLAGRTTGTRGSLESPPPSEGGDRWFKSSCPDQLAIAQAGEHGVVIPGVRVRVPLATPPARGETDDHGRLRTCSRRFESSRADQRCGRSSKAEQPAVDRKVAGSIPVVRAKVLQREGASGAARPPPRKGGRAAYGARLENGFPFGDVSSNLTPSSRFVVRSLTPFNETHEWRNRQRTGL